MLIPGCLFVLAFMMLGLIGFFQKFNSQDTTWVKSVLKEVLTIIYMITAASAMIAHKAMPTSPLHFSPCKCRVASATCGAVLALGHDVLNLAGGWRVKCVLFCLSFFLSPFGHGDEVKQKTPVRSGSDTEALAFGSGSSAAQTPKKAGCANDEAAAKASQVINVVIPEGVRAGMTLNVDWEG